MFASLLTIDFSSQLSEVRSDAPIQLADYRKLMMFIFSCNLYNLLIPPHWKFRANPPLPSLAYFVKKKTVCDSIMAWLGSTDDTEDRAAGEDPGDLQLHQPNICPTSHWTQLSWTLNKTWNRTKSSLEDKTLLLTFSIDYQLKAFKAEISKTVM